MAETLKILIAEDSVADAELLVHELTLAGFDLNWRRVDTEEAYVSILDEDLDIIFSDFQMPRFSGARALELLVATGRDIPFITVSGTIGEERAVDMVKAGATDYVLKDRLRRLGPVVRRALREAAVRAERKRTDAELRNLEGQLRQAQKMEAIGQLAGGVAHDFNNMLQVIRGNAAMLLDSEVKAEEIPEFGREIVKAADRAAELTRQLLLFSRKETMQPANLDLNEIAGNVAKMLQRIVGDNIRLHGKFAARVPLIYADAGMVEQVLMNLVINARDAMPKGGNLTISTSVETIAENSQMPNPEAAPGTYVCLAVADEGCGIAPENMGRIFEPFFTTKEAGKGTGFGLATSYGIVKQHHGWIAVTSQIDQGSTFRVYLPALPGAEEKHKGVVASSKMARGTETILVVEDDVTLRLLVCSLLGRCGYTIHSAATGAEAVQVWKEHHEKIRLLFTDMVMPDGMTGRELALKLRSEQRELKVVYTSGYSNDLLGKDRRWLENAVFLQKPYAPQQLAQTVRDCLDGKIREV